MPHASPARLAPGFFVARQTLAPASPAMTPGKAFCAAGATLPAHSHLLN
jgi:hypothetical protein